ncbi:MAG TPA: outer membrane lipoprotein carrier protein LolA [Longimicrobiales bacterium]|nr:outer membrane lipoprotein carrier protein LolA [Longimicrobiales bacterium]
MKLPAAGCGLLILLLTASGCGDRDRAPAPSADTVGVARPDTTIAAAPASARELSSDDSAPAGPGGGGEAARPAPAGPAPSAATGGSPVQPSAPNDSAAEILRRAAQRYRAIGTLQADFTMRLENPLLRSTIESAGVLYQKRPDRLLLRFTEPAGDVIASDGEYFWVYYPSVDAEQVIRSPAAAGGRTGVDLQAQFLGDPTTRFRYTLEAVESVAGRPAWRMQLVPRERVGYRSLRVWLDQRDQLARRFEITEDNGSIRRFELRNVQVDPTLADELFRFQPPSGVRVISQ